jgi:hypothetical protein
MMKAPQPLARQRMLCGCQGWRKLVAQDFQKVRAIGCILGNKPSAKSNDTIHFCSALRMARDILD